MTSSATCWARSTAILLALVFTTACDGSGSAGSSPKRFPDQYDRLIQQATSRYLGRSWTWERYWGQLYQESLQNLDAVSHAGARGIAQFMPRTWVQIAGELGFSAGPHSARHAIPAGAYYMRKLYAKWTAERPTEDRKRLAESSYNAGFGGVLRAQRRCGGAVLYEGIAPCLPDETRTYVRRIQHWYRLKR